MAGAVEKTLSLAAAFQKLLRDDEEVLSLERAILERVVYKNRNQHQRANYFGKLLEARKRIAALDDVSLRAKVDEFQAAATVVEKGFKALAPCDMKYVDGLISESEVILKKYHRAIEAMKGCYCVMRVLLGQTYFMPLATVCMSIMSRYFVVFGRHEAALATCAQFLRKNRESIGVEAVKRMREPIREDHFGTKRKAESGSGDGADEKIKKKKKKKKLENATKGIGTKGDGISTKKAFTSPSAGEVDDIFATLMPTAGGASKKKANSKSLW